MAGHVEDRWWRDRIDDNGNAVLTPKGKPVREKTELHGKGQRYRVRYYVDKRERSRSFPDGKKRLADDFLAQVQGGQMPGADSSRGTGTVKLNEYAANYLRGQSENPITQNRYKSVLENMINPFFGDTDLFGVTRDRVREWLEWMQSKREGKVLSANYRGQAFDVLAAVMNAAFDDGKIRENPFRAKSIKRPKVEHRKVKPWSDEKLWKIHDALAEHYRIVVPLGVGLGLRQMEIFGLSIDDFDHGKKELNVTRQIVWIGGVPVFGPPKGGKERVVPCGDALRRVVDAYAEEHEPFTVTLPWKRLDGEPVTASLLINKTTDGVKRFGKRVSARLWNAGDFRKSVWVPAFDEAGVTRVNQWDGMHALRHLFASNMLAEGVSIRELSEFMGHHDPAFTLRIYTHLMPSSFERARAASDKMIKPRPQSDAA